MIPAAVARDQYDVREKEPVDHLVSPAILCCRFACEQERAAASVWSEGLILGLDGAHWALPRYLLHL